MTLSLEKSKQAHQRAQKVIVGGVNSPVRSFARVGRTPLLASHASGAHVFDLDGNKYIDLVLSYGPHLFGHAHPLIVERIHEAAKKGLGFGLTTEVEIEWSERLLKHFPNLDRVRAMNSGTEACMTAIRLARGYTKKEVILKFSGHYHGHVDWLMVDSGSGIATLSNELNPDSDGLPKSVAESVRVLPFNSEILLEEFFKEEGDNLAGVILEPVMGNMGVIPAKVEWLDRLRKLCTAHKAVLILDEVMSGFRASSTSAQGLYNIKPDLCCLGKVVGGGMPVSALAGTQEIMECLAPMGKVYQAGTLSGNPVGIAAGLAMLDLIEKEEPFSQMEELGSWTQSIFESAIEKYKIDANVIRRGSMFSVFFRKHNPENARDATDINHELFSRYFWAMIEEGIMIPPSSYEAYFLSTAHGAALKNGLEGKVDRVFKKIS
ncbi:aminotransferase class III-fold pyridoxal phosphate-dependent enzyme [bacterium]|nr:aminotransferase class III-fold pyridoxal phosphate-dependent enzyme [bacterium]